MWVEMPLVDQQTQQTETEVCSVIMRLILMISNCSNTSVTFWRIVIVTSLKAKTVCCLHIVVENSLNWIYGDWCSPVVSLLSWDNKTYFCHTELCLFISSDIPPISDFFSINYSIIFLFNLIFQAKYLKKKKGF